MQEAGRNMVNSDCIVKAYGVARGPLPAEFSSMVRYTYIYMYIYQTESVYIIVAHI